MVVAAACGSQPGLGEPDGETGASTANTSETAAADVDNGDTTGGLADGQLAWALRFDNTAFHRIIAGTHGGVLAAGKCRGEDYTGSPLPDPDEAGLCPLWLDGDGVVRWSAGFQANGESLAPAAAIAQDTDENVYVAGTNLASFDGTGAHRWSEVIAGWVLGVVAARDGSVYVSTEINYSDEWTLLRFDTLGVQQWAKTFDGPTNGCGRACDNMVADAEGNLYLFGVLDSPYDFGGGALAGPDTYPVGTQCTAPLSSFVASFDRDGTHRWSRRLAPVDADGDSRCGDSLRITAIAIEADGNVYLTGGLAGTVDFGSGAIETDTTYWDSVSLEIYVASFTSDGAPRWSVGLGPGALPPMDGDVGRSVTVDAAGTVHVCAGVRNDVFDLGDGTTFEGSGTVLVRFDRDGTRLGTVGFAGVQGNAIAAGIDGAVYFAGSYSGEVDLGPSHLPGPGGAYLAKLPPPE